MLLITSAFLVKETLSFTKYRSVFNFKDCKLFIDNLFEETYLEIEGAKDEDILETMDFFGFTEKDIEKNSYFQIVHDYNSKNV